MAKKFRDLVAKMPAGSQARAHERGRLMLAELQLQELRQQLDVSQEALAELLGVSQPSISKMESRTDPQVSTVRRFIEAMGGELEIAAKFPDGTKRIIRVGDMAVKRATG